jgi:hypothetical protein
MKTTMLFRPIANPRRTRLAALTDAEPRGQAERNTEVEDASEAAETLDAAETAGAAEAGQTRSRPLPQQTANPRRTVLTELPNRTIAAE